MIWLRALLLILALVLPVQAEEIVADMSQARVAITADFDGSEILIFGAIRREAPLPAGPMSVVITVEGPSTPVTVRKKDRVAGIWINTEAVDVDAAPSFYAIATSAPLREAITETEDLRHHVSIPQAIRAVDAATGAENAEDFVDALIRIRASNDLYQLLEEEITVSADTLFDTLISLPSNLTEGTYRTRIFLTREGDVIDQFETAIDVRKVGLEKFIYNLAHDRPLIYGLFSLFIAIAAGWLASAFFRYIRGA